jgi:hypothetical protein
MVLSLAYHKHGDMVRSCHEKYVLMDVELGREVRDSCLATQAIFSMHFDAFLVSISFTFFHVLLIFPRLCRQEVTGLIQTFVS